MVVGLLIDDTGFPRPIGMCDIPEVELKFRSRQGSMESRDRWKIAHRFQRWL